MENSTQLTRKEKRHAKNDAYNLLKQRRKEVTVARYERNTGDVAAHFRGGVVLNHDVYGKGRVKAEDYNKGGFVAFYPNTQAGRRNGSPVHVSAKRLTPVG